MKYVIPAVITGAMLVGGMNLVTPAFADEHEHHQGEQHHAGEHHSGHHNMAWMKSLSAEQRSKIDALHADFKKQKHALKEKMQSAKHDLHKEIATDTPNKQAINDKIDAILKLKKQKLQLKVEHKMAVRKLLNKEQKAMFDEHLLNKDKYCNKHKQHH